MLRDVAATPIPGFQSARVGRPDLEGSRARLSHEVAAGHCTDCDGFLEMQARSAASGVTATMVGVAPLRTARVEDRVSISSTARTAALRGTEDASVRSRSTEETERVLDAEAADPAFRRAGPNPLDLGAEREGRLTAAVDSLATILDEASSEAEAEAGVDAYLQALDPQTRDDLQAFVRTLPPPPGAGDAPPPPGAPPPGAKDAKPADAPAGPPAAADEAETEAGAETDAGPGPKSPEDLEPAELRQLEELKARDREVRAHEQAHKAAAGQHGGAVSYEYQSGPDGKKYAVGGEVSVDLSPVRGDPQATVQKMQQVRRAALAPADPSSADRGVAARAAQLAQEAQVALRQERAAAAEDDPAASGETPGAEPTGEAASAGPDAKGTPPSRESEGAPSATESASGTPPAATATGALKSKPSVADAPGAQTYASAIVTGAALNFGVTGRGGLNVVA